MLLFTYILNNTLLLIHEIESGYEEEWKIFNLPFGITGFLIIHVPFIIPMFYGAIGIQNGSKAGLISGIVWGIIGILPIFMHKLFFYKDNKFNRLSSNILFVSNLITGISLITLTILNF